ncbi:hypothetical protein ACFLRU_07050 [Bacteroidota bacterium]
MQNDFETVIRLVEQRFDRGNAKNWQNKEYTDLSFAIRKKTKVSISVSTLKRIFGKVSTPNRYYPQKATLEALINYSGYEFQQAQTNSVVKPNKKYKKLALFAIPLLITCVGIIFFANSFKNIFDNPTNASIELITIDGNNPATVFLRYDTPITDDSLFINFGDGYEPVYIIAGKKEISRYYRFPGIFNITIEKNDQVISDTLKIKIETNGWEALAYYFDQQYKDRFYPLLIKESYKNNALFYSTSELSDFGIDTGRIVMMRLDNYFANKNNADNFIFKTRIKRASYWPVLRCYGMEIIIAGEKGDISFKFIKPGCSKWANYKLSEKIVDGDSKQVTSLGIDFSDFKTILIKNINQSVSLIVDEQEIINDTYKKSIGNICGISYIFHGNGSVDYTFLQVADSVIVNKDF